MSIYEFKLPDIGEGVVEGEIVKWLVKEGDLLKEDQPMVEVMTDKATVTIPSPKKGKVLKTHGKEGEIALVHHPLVTLELEGGAPAAASAVVVSNSNGHAAPVMREAPAGAKVLATPVTRRMASEHGLNLASIMGSGPQGRVTKADVEATLREGGVLAPGVMARAPMAPSAPLQSSQGDQRIALKGLRKKIAEKMVKAKFTAPHYTFVEEVDVTPLVDMRNRMNVALGEAGLPKISFLPFLCKALVGAFKQFPQVNANMDEATQELIVRGDIHIGIAASTDEGLTVPVVRHADRLTLKQLSEEILRLGNAARERKLKMEELTNGTFTITSLGQTGGLFATPIINHPEVAIMGVHRMRKRPVVNEKDEIVVRQMMYLSFSFDHRVIDGAVGADFAYAVIKTVSNPDLLMLEMA
ncbi:MAG: 2-oxo acid dehydrogenase subunit E2 [Myxococcaceae bacterium]|nr:2-oxo acid dehydrogenase subunit E2 [Myxococcaceae bacterium]